MAEVFRARVLSGPRAGWQVAIKRLAPELAKKPECVDQFTTEADLSKLLDHPNIVEVFEVGVIQDIYFIAMELVEGSDLARILRRCKSRGIHLPVDFAVFLAKVLLDALDYAHSVRSSSGKPLGVVHCDVSISYFFIFSAGEIKLGDFGVARARTTSPSEAAIHGKPYYLSPELLEGKITPAVDLWAANVTLYELLTLQRPYDGDNLADVAAAMRMRSHRAVRQLRPEVTPALEQVIERGFAVPMQGRFQSAAEFSRALAPHYDERIGTPL